MSLMKKYKFAALAVLALAFALGFAREHVDHPYSWVMVWGGLAACFFFLALQARRKSRQYFSVTLTAAMLALLAMELKVSYPYFSTHKSILSTRHELSSVPTGQEVNASDPAAVTSSRHILKAGDETAYDVLVSVFPGGNRVTPYHPEAETAVILLGCSFTFGTGLDDRQTFAWLLGEKCGDSCMVYNYGRPGHGAHQMLDLLESGRLDEIAARHKQMRVIFTTFADHALRSAGYTSREARAPWYELENGQVVRKGRFGEQGSVFDRQVYRFFKRSQLYRSLMMPKADRLQPYMELYVALIKKSDQVLRRRYGSSLTVALWPDNDECRRILDREGLELLDLGPYFPDYRQNPEKYKILHDGHPNALAAAITAEAFYERLKNAP